MELRGIEQGAVKARGDQRPCRPRRGDTPRSAATPAASQLDARVAPERDACASALPNGRIRSGSVPISKIACTLFSRPSTQSAAATAIRADARGWRGVRPRSGSSAQRSRGTPRPARCAGSANARRCRRRARRQASPAARRASRARSGARARRKSARSRLAIRKASTRPARTACVIAASKAGRIGGRRNGRQRHRRRAGRARAAAETRISARGW